VQHRVVVRGQRSWRRGLLVLLGLALAAIGGYAAWQALPDRARPGVQQDGGSELEQLREERRRLTREVRALRGELAEARGRSTFESRGCQIDAQACAAVRATVGGLESEVAQLREQLAFYRSIAAPDEMRAGVRVLRLGLRPGSGEREWRYDLVLVQPMRRDRTATGRYRLTVEGLQDQRMKTLDLAALGIGPAQDPTFAFRSFQEFAGDLRLPPGFLPSRLTITLAVQTGKNEVGEVSESFDWSTLASAARES
jgi:hypothetical protein